MQMKHNMHRNINSTTEFTFQFFFRQGQTLTDFSTEICLYVDSYKIVFKSDLGVKLNIHIFRPHTSDLEVGIQYKTVVKYLKKQEIQKNKIFLI